MTTLRVRLSICASAAVAAIGLAGCGGSSTGNQLPQGTAGTMSVAQELPAAPVVAGTYTGDITVSEGSHKLSGTVTIGLMQKGARLHGTFDASVSGQTLNLKLVGNVRAGKKGANVHFNLTDPSNGCKGKSTGIVDGSNLDGSGAGQACSGLGSFTFKYTTTKR